MKKLLATALTLTFILGETIPFDEYGSDFIDKNPITVSAESDVFNFNEYNGFNYEVLDDNTVQINHYEGSEKKLTIPSTIDGKEVSRIASMAFSECTGLEELTIENNLTAIDDWAFYACNSLETVTISGDVKEIGQSAFQECEKLKTVNISGSINTLGEWAFCKCNALSNVIISGSIKKIDQTAFQECAKLKTVNISGKVNSIGESAFYGCNSLETVTISGKVNSIGEYAFYGCKKLSNVKLNEGLRSIGEGAFMTFTRSNQNSIKKISLRKITIPKSVTKIGHCAVGFEPGGFGVIPASYFTIRCYKGTAGEKYAKENGFNFEIITKKSGTSISGLKSTVGKIKVTVSKGKGIKKYQLQYATNKNFNKAKTVTTTSVNKVIKAKSKKIYYLRVRSINGSKAGAWSAVKKIRVK